MGRARHYDIRPRITVRVGLVVGGLQPDGYCARPNDKLPPSTQWKIERMHRCLKNSLRARLLGRVNWLSELPWVMLGLRAASNLDTGVSPSILVTGQQPTLPGQLVVQRPTIDDASDFGRKLASAMAAQTFHENPWHKKRRGHSYVPLDQWTSKFVLVRADKVQSSLVPKYTGPFRVLLPFAVREPQRHSLCRQTTTLLRGRDGSSRTGYRRRRHREKRHHR